MNNNNDELMHYGVLGMKWGKRKAQTTSSAYNKARSTKASYKQGKKDFIKSAVKDYNKKFNRAERASNIADKKWREVNKKYESLGKNRVERMINAAKGKSAAAKDYTKSYNEASKMSDSADAKWREARTAYKKTGKTYVSRIFNNVKYDQKRITYKEEKAKAKSEWLSAAEKHGKSNTKSANDAYEKAADKYIADIKAAKKKRWK